jgi:tripartite-type tricarboxylate transporter receptor subunit TctC
MLLRRFLLRRLVATILVALAIPTARSAIAQTSRPFFEGKQMRLIVGTSSGQDYDLWARLIARHLSDHIPGAPTIIVEDMPGAGHITATNYLYNQAARDGTVLGMVTRNIVDDAVIGLKGARFDPLQFNWIGSPELSHRVLLVSRQSGIERPEDLRKHELIIGATGVGQAVTTAPLLLQSLLDFKIKVVQGYASPDDVVLAMQRGEVGGIVDTIGTGANDPRRKWIESGSMRILFNMEPEPVADFHAPSLFSLLTTDAQRQVFGFLASSMELGRPILAPPGVPAERIALLRKAFQQTVTDPAFLKDATSQGFEVTYVSGEEIVSRVKSTMMTPKAIAKEAEEGVAGK